MEHISDADLRRPDNAGRINIGKENCGKIFAVQPQPDGNILLSPVVVMHEREAWLFNNPEALASVRKGIEESAKGKGTSLGSFAQYMDDDLED